MGFAKEVNENGQKVIRLRKNKRNKMCKQDKTKRYDKLVEGRIFLDDQKKATSSD